MTSGVMVKYFKEGDKHYYEEGKLRFGSLEDYRSREDAELAARFTDSREGITQANISRLRGPGLSMHRSFVATVVDANVFCASKGPYDAEHHERMKNGDGNYSGNSELTNYCVIDLARFRYALNMLRPGNIIAVRPNPSFDEAEVTYGDRNASIADGWIGSLEGYHVAAQWRAVFTKPTYFATEREVRFVLRQFSSPSVRIARDAAYLQSDLLRESIVQFGP
jgi:hypothetical protein